MAADLSLYVDAKACMSACMLAHHQETRMMCFCHHVDKAACDVCLRWLCICFNHVESLRIGGGRC